MVFRGALSAPPNTINWRNGVSSRSFACKFMRSVSIARTRCRWLQFVLTMNEASRHRCLIYDGSPSAQMPAMAAIITERLSANYRCLYLNSPPMIAGLPAHLRIAGVDPTDAVARGALVLSSDQGHLVDGEFDVERMLVKLSDAVKQALSEGYAGLWASGDMLWEFGSERNLAKLLTYEIGLESLLESQPALCGICQYHRDILPEDGVKIAIYTHQAVYLNESLVRLNSHYRQVATLRRSPNAAGAQVDDLLNSLRKQAE